MQFAGASTHDILSTVGTFVPEHAVQPLWSTAVQLGIVAGASQATSEASHQNPVAQLVQAPPEATLQLVIPEETQELLSAVGSPSVQTAQSPELLAASQLHSVQALWIDVQS